MKRFKVLVIAACLVFVIMPIQAVKAQNEHPRAVSIMDDYKGPTVTISGRVFKNNFNPDDGKILVLVKTGMGQDNPNVAQTKLSAPGEYSIVVPKDYGEVYVTGVQYKDRPIVFDEAYRGGYVGNPIKIGSTDIKGLDMILTKRPSEELPRIPKPGKYPTLMDEYNGPTVTISGVVSEKTSYSPEEILTERRPNEAISILAKTNPEKGNLAVARTVIFMPGEYSIVVPKDYGDIYIFASHFKPNQPGLPPASETIKGPYSQNPVKVGSADINGIDIYMSLPSAKEKVYMNTYNGPTVTISGKISAQDPAKAAGAEIAIAAKSKLAVDSVPVATTVISGTGEYSLKVPEGFGELYIGAAQEKSGQVITGVGSLRGLYKNNPVTVGSSDINGVDIELSPKEK